LRAFFPLVILRALFSHVILRAFFSLVILREAKRSRRIQGVARVLAFLDPATSRRMTEVGGAG